jgi:RNA polymerase primary sigma factor
VYGRGPTTEEVAEELGMTPERVEQLRKDDINYVFLDAATDTGQEIPLHGFILDERATSPSEESLQNDNHAVIHKLLGSLNKRDKDILLRRFGFNGYTPQTLEEIGKVYKVTRERIRQIEYNSMKKLRLRAPKAGLVP